MADRTSKEARSHLMSKIKAKDTKPELLVRHFLFSKGFRYRLHSASLPGKPDIVLSKYKTVIFINGCFWHRHNYPKCYLYKEPKSNVKYWQNKILTNVFRDRQNIKVIKNLGWRVITVWECQLQQKSGEVFLMRLVRKLKSPAVKRLK